MVHRRKVIAHDPDPKKVIKALSRLKKEEMVGPYLTYVPKPHETLI